MKEWGQTKPLSGTIQFICLRPVRGLHYGPFWADSPLQVISIV